MTEPRAIQGTFSDMKFVRSRQVVQVIVEVDMAGAQHVMDHLGAPSDDKWVAVALMRQQQTIEGSVAREKKEWGELTRAQQAGILCSDEGFQRYVHQNVHKLSEMDPERCARAVRWYCGVESRSQLDDSQEVAAKWDALVREYRRAG